MHQNWHPKKGLKNSTIATHVCLNFWSQNGSNMSETTIEENTNTSMPKENEKCGSLVINCNKSDIDTINNKAPQ
jgi:hypothetical protein